MAFQNRQFSVFFCFCWFGADAKSIADLEADGVADVSRNVSLSSMSLIVDVRVGIPK